MSKKSETIFGMRRPTIQEKAWILKYWGYEIENHMFYTNGKFVGFIGVFLTIASIWGIANNLNLVSAIICIILAIICFFFSKLLKRHGILKKNISKALATEDFYVADATSIKIGYGLYEGKRRYFTKVCLANGHVLDEHYPIPEQLASPLVQQKINTIPILVVIIQGDYTLRTITIPEDSNHTN